jgi:PKD repeat protein
VLTIQAAEGMAPFTAHVHAVGSILDSGSMVTADVSWDFGDPLGSWNHLRGFNAAHVYDEPGSYAITLTLVDQDGAVATASAAVTVLAAARTPVHVSPAGDDANDGATPGSAVRTMARAAELVGDATAILFERGAVHPVPAGMWVGCDDVLVGAYGDGPRPLLWWQGPELTSAAMIHVDAAAGRVTVQDLEFGSAAVPGNQIVRAINAGGSAVTVRRCGFGAVSYAIRAAGSPAGVMSADNQAGALGAYFVWGEGTDHCHVGNVVAGSIDEHNMRFLAERVLVSGNDLTNLAKRTIWCLDGGWAWVAGNRLTGGALVIGPRPQDEGGWTHAVVESNRLAGESMIVRHGSAHVRLSSNLIQRDAAPAIDVWGYDGAMDRTCSDVRVLHNTIINLAPSGRGVSIGLDTAAVVVANNMYLAPHLETGSQGTANAFVADDSLDGACFAGNLWAEPAVVGWGNGWHYLWPYWSDPVGYRTPEEWAALPGTQGERYRAFAPADLDPEFRPLFNAELSPAQPGAHRDLWGAARPLAGLVTVGAVELPGTAHPGDVDGDGSVTAADLALLVQAWGDCPATPQPCPADLSADGGVGEADLSILIASWD